MRKFDLFFTQIIYISSQNVVTNFTDNYFIGLVLVEQLNTQILKCYEKQSNLSSTYSSRILYFILKKS